MSNWMTSLSLPNPFKPSQEEEEEEEEDEEQEEDRRQQQLNPTDTTPPTDLSVLGHTLGLQLRGVAAFLAPPPSSSPSAPSKDDVSSETLVGIRNDLVEIGDSFKTSLSLLSSNKTVTGISRFTTNLLHFGGEEEEEDDVDDEEAVAITEEVAEFVDKISKQPELWTDFPLTLPDDCPLSDAQRVHTETIEDLVPSLAPLRREICKYLSQEKFWMIYFLLLLPRLNENDFELLSTPKTVELRNILLELLQNKNNTPMENSTEVSETDKTVREGSKVNSAQANESRSHGRDFLNREANVARGLKKDGVNTPTSVDDAQKQSEGEVTSFTDAEDDDNDAAGKQSGLRRSEINRVPSCCESNEWVKVNDGQKAVESTSREKDSSSDESSDWQLLE